MCVLVCVSLCVWGEESHGEQDACTYAHVIIYLKSHVCMYVCAQLSHADVHVCARVTFNSQVSCFHVIVPRRKLE